MRSQEFVQEKINPEVINPGFKIEHQLPNGFIIQATAKEPYYDDPSEEMRALRGVTIRVFDPKADNWMQKKYGVGEVKLLAKQNRETGEWDLRPVSVGVDKEYQRQGIASAMYNFARKLGNDVIPSPLQTDQGKAFWASGAGKGRDLEVTDLPEPKIEPKAEPKIEPKVEPNKPQGWMQRFKNILTPQPVAEDELDEIYRIPQGDFGDADTIVPPKHDVEKKELPGGSGLTYAVDKTSPEDLEIMIFDGDTLAAELDLFDTRDVTGAWRVSTVAVNPKYRGQGLGKALYGIALSILKLTLEAGDTQTKHGQQMWLMLNSIPGVEVMGYNMERTPKYKAQPGDKIIKQDKDWTRYTFPVAPGKHSMRSSRRGTGMYTSQASMLAKWTGQ